MSISKMNVLCFTVLAAGAFVFAAEEKKEEKKVICPVSGKAAAENQTADYRSAKVRFCCGNCAAEFAKNTTKYAAKANQQLVSTGQATQAKCPLSGGKLNDEQTCDVGGVKVTFCCGDCKGKVEAAKGDDQVNLVFSDTAFDKGFEVKKSK